MNLKIIFLVSIFQLLMGQIALADGYQIYMEKHGPTSSGGGQGSGIDLSHIFHDSPEVKKMQQRAQEIDRIAASIKNTSQRIAVKKQAIKRLKGIAKRRNAIREKVKHMNHSVIRTRYVNIATSSIAASRDFYIANKFESGMIAANMAETALDLATTWTPGVSWGRDIYEALTGKHLITGAALGIFERGMATFGAATMGFGSKIGKVFKVVQKMMKGRGAAKSAKIVGKALKSAQKGLKSPVEKWVGTAPRGFRNNADDFILESQDGLRQIRFDFNRATPHTNPHIHVIEYSIEKNRKIEEINRRIFP